jgi:hypothetical protein
MAAGVFMAQLGVERRESPCTEAEPFRNYRLPRELIETTASSRAGFPVSNDSQAVIECNEISMSGIVEGSRQTQRSGSVYSSSTFRLASSTNTASV